eukprot:m51a1_g10619 hypothetical protein (423) ;mRNA; r:57479-59030
MSEVRGTFERINPRFTHNKLGRDAILVSNFMLTMNTNVRLAGTSDAELEALSEPLYNMAQEMFDGSERLSRFVQFGTQGGRDPLTNKYVFLPDPTRTWGTELVVDYKVTASAEIGHNTRGSRLHMHVGIKIRHHSYVKLDRDLIFEEANRFLESVDYPALMFNIVHGVKLQLCQWTGETIKKRFRMPLPRNKGWTGCYGAPGIVVSAIVQNGNQSKLTPDEINELIDIFEASLRREPGFEQTKFTITPAPSYKLLKTWGGNLSLQEFHQQYQHDESVEIYRQVIPDKTYTETFVDVDKTDVPFLRTHASKTSCLEAVVVYLHPAQDTVLGLGNPKDWGEDGNKAASHLLGKCTVFGDCVVLHKNKIRERKKRAASEEPEQAPVLKKARTEASVPSTPVNTPAPADVPPRDELVDSIMAALDN